MASNKWELSAKINIEEAEKSIKKIQSDYKNLGNKKIKLSLDSTDLQSKMKKAKNDTTKFNQELSKSKKNKIGLDSSNFNKALGESMASLGKFKGGFLSFGKLIAGAVIFKQIAGQVKEVVQAFDAGTDNIIKKTGGINESMKKGLINAAKITGESMGVTGNVLGELNTRFQFTGEQLEKSTIAFLRFAKVNELDGVTAVRLVSRAMGDAGIPAKDFQNVLDLLTKAAQQSGISVEVLTENLTKYGAPMRALGFSTKESIALFSQWEKAGVNTEIAFSGMKKAISNFASAGKDGKKEFAKVLKEIQKTGDISKATTEAIDIFGAKAGPDLADAILSGRFSIEESIKALEGFEGATDSAAKAIEDDFLSQIGKTFNAISVESGRAFEPLDKNLGSIIKNFNDGLGEGGQYRWIFDIVLPLTLIAVILVGIGITIKIITITAGLLSFVLSPIFLIIVGIGLAIAAVILIVQNWGAIVDWLGQQWNNFVNLIGNEINKMVDSWKGGINLIGDGFNWLVTEAGKAVQSIINFFTSIPQKIRDALFGLKDLIVNAIPQPLRSALGLGGRFVFANELGATTGLDLKGLNGEINKTVNILKTHSQTITNTQNKDIINNVVVNAKNAVDVVTGNFLARRIGVEHS